MKKVFLFSTAVLAVAFTQAAVVLVEDFNYVAGSALEGQGSPSAWTVSTKVDNSVEATPSFTISSEELEKDNYGVAAGLGVTLPQATLAVSGKQRVLYKTFDTNSSVRDGALYAAFLIKVSNATTGTRDFMSYEGSTGTTQRGRVFTKKSGDGYQLGVTRGSTTPIWSETLVLGQTYLAVLKYEFVDGALNDEVTLFVDFPQGYAETSSSVQAKAIRSTDVDAATSDPSSLKAFSLKLRDGGSALQIAHLRVATSWEDAVNYTGSSVEPEDPNRPVAHFEEGFDSNGSWTLVNSGTSTSKNHGYYGTDSRCLSFNLTVDRDRCNGSKVISPQVNTAGVLRFFVVGSANETRGNIRVSKIVGTDTTEVAYIEGPFNKDWAEQTVIVNDASSAVKIMLEVSDCGLGAGTVYIDDISLMNFVAGEGPVISNISLTEAAPTTDALTAVAADIVAGEGGRTISEAVVEWGYNTQFAGGRAVMRKTSGERYVSQEIGANRAGTVYYRVIAFDSYYVSDTSAVQSFVVTQSEKPNLHYPLVFTRSPQTLQLYPRVNGSSATVTIAGYNAEGSAYGMQLRMYRNGVLQEEKVVNKAANETFAETFSIVAEPADYKFTYVASNAQGEELLADSVVAGDVYVIAGQSNGAAAASGNPGVTNPYWRNFGCVQKTAVYNPADTLWGLSNSAGWGYGRQFYNGYSGYVLQRNILQEQQMPTAVINIAIGGSSLNQNLRNDEEPEDLTTFYGEGLYRLRRAGLAEAVKAIIWVQGESDQNGLYEDYAVRFEKLYQAWKEDYPNVEHIYLSQINVGCSTSPYASELREVQRKMQEVHSDITVITNIGITIRYDSCHYVDDGYERLYGQYSRLIERDFYGKTFPTALTSPNVESVYWQDDTHSAIVIRFDQQMQWPERMWGRDMKDYFFDENDAPLLVTQGYTDPADRYKVVLDLQAGQSPTHLTYGPDNYVFSSTRGMDTLYVDPWLRNDEGYAALTFNRYPIADHDATGYVALDSHTFCRVEGDMLIAESTGGVDSIELYSPTGGLIARTETDHCRIASLPQGIYAVRVITKRGETLVCKINR